MRGHVVARWVWLVLVWGPGHAVADDFVVDAAGGGDFVQIQPALQAAQAGDRVLVRTGTYQEQLVFPRDGVPGQVIELRAYPGETPVLDGGPFSGGNMVLLDNRSHVVVRGFTIGNLSGVSDGSGIRVIGAGTGVSLLDNTIHHILGDDAMGITVYGTEATPITELLIQGNTIHDCEPARSEALTLNGNVTCFEVSDNVVRDVNNIGIDFIGGETDINPDPDLVARDGLCARNIVLRARSIYGGGYGAGIYVDGGRDILIEHNVVSECDLGIEIGAENAGRVTSGIVVRGNRVFRNDKVGIVFGGYEAAVGRTQHCFFLDNLCYDNDTLGEGLGELWIQFASLNTLRDNLFVAGAGNVMMYSEGGNTDNSLDNNLWFSEGSAAEASWVWRGTEYQGFAAYRTGSGQDAAGLWGDPLWTDRAGLDFHLEAASPAVDAAGPDAGLPIGTTDMDGQARVQGAGRDIGPDEFSAAPPCLGALWPQWYGATDLACADAVLTVAHLTALLNGSCSCPGARFLPLIRP